MLSIDSEDNKKKMRKARWQVYGLSMFQNDTRRQDYVSCNTRRTFDKFRRNRPNVNHKEFRAFNC